MKDFIYIAEARIWLRLSAVTMVTVEPVSADLILLAGAAQFKIPISSASYASVRKYLADASGEAVADGAGDAVGELGRLLLVPKS